MTLRHLGRSVCGELAQAIDYEWLVTNGIGGFAAGTVCEANTRRYHGLLIAALAPPVARTLMVAALDVAVTYASTEHRLATHEFNDGTVAPRGYLYSPSDFSTCPPNSNRIADNSLSANAASPRELNRE